MTFVHHMDVFFTFCLCRFQWVSGTRGSSQIRTDLTDPAHGPDGSIGIGELRTQDIGELRFQPKNQ